MPRIQAGVESARKRRRPSARELLAKMYLPNAIRAQVDFLGQVATASQFMAIVERKHSKGSPEYSKIKKAFDVNSEVFKGVLRKTGEPYARHPIRCALMLMLYLDIWDADAIAAALLHDVTEKERRRWNIRRIVREFGRLVALYVRGMTRPKEIPGKRNKLQVDALYHEQLARADVMVLILKGLDRWDNIATMWLHSDQELHDKNRETDEFIFPLLEKHQDHPAVGKLLAGLHATMEFAAAKRLPRAA